MNNKAYTNRLYRGCYLIFASVLMIVIFLHTTGYGAVVSQNKISDKSKSFMTFQNDRVSMNAPLTSLNDVMIEFSRVTGIEIVWQGEHDDCRISANISNRSIGDALAYLLKGENYLLLYSAADDTSVNKVIILPDHAESINQKNEDLFPYSNTAHQAVPSYEAHVMDEFAAMEGMKAERNRRHQEIREIASLDSRQARDQLTTELAVNEDPEARLLALQKLNDHGDISTDLLMETVSAERDPRVQLRAMDLLVKRAESDPSIEGFLTSFIQSQMRTQ